MIFTRSIEEIKTEEALASTNHKVIYMSLGCVAIAFIIVAIVMYYKKAQSQNTAQNKSVVPSVSDVQESLKSYGHKVLGFVTNNVGIRFLRWKTETDDPWRKRAQDIIQNLMLLVNAVDKRMPAKH